MRHWNIIFVNIVTIIHWLPVFSCKMTDNLMSIKIIVNPLSFLLSTLLKSHYSSIKLPRFFQIIYRNCQVEWIKIMLCHMNIQISIFKDNLYQIEYKIKSNFFVKLVLYIKIFIRINYPIKIQANNKNKKLQCSNKRFVHFVNKLRIMKQLEFEHFRKAPHPFQQYGYLPPTALKNRSIPNDFGSLPQGEDAFIQKIGKKPFNQKYQSSFGNNRLGDYKDESLVRQMAKYNRGKSLQTNDIQGAQGGSLKSPAVKYKEKAHKLKLEGKLNDFDRIQYEKQQYKRNIEYAIKKQHQNDKQIGKFISYKGHGHYLNPQKSVAQNNRAGSSKKDNIPTTPLNTEKYQPYLKMKHQTFDSKNQNYKNFFSELKNKQDNYNQFFDKLKSNLKRPDYSNQPYTQIPEPLSYSPKVQSKQLLKKYRTVQLQKEFKNSYEPYSQRNFSKRSIQSQFKKQQQGGSNILEHLQNSRLKNDQNNSLSSSRKSQPLSFQQLRNQQKKYQQISRIARKFNPTHLSTAVNAPNFNSNIYK